MQEAAKESVFERTWVDIYEGRWRVLIGQLECGLEVLIGWEPHARTYARMIFLERSLMRSPTHASFN